MKKPVLIVEDDADIARNLKELLELDGYPVHLAANGRHALEELPALDPAPGLILLDLMMPVMDGVQFRRQQEQDQRLAPIPVILMTADAQIESTRMRVGAHGFIKKPIDTQPLLALVARFCD